MYTHIHCPFVQKWRLTFCFLTDSGMEKCLGSSSKVTTGISSWGSHNTATTKERAGGGRKGEREREREGDRGGRKGRKRERKGEEKRRKSQIIYHSP
jgi:hypothetical protein